jgi:hypothetical protein
LNYTGYEEKVVSANDLLTKSRKITGKRKTQQLIELYKLSEKFPFGLMVSITIAIDINDSY